MQPPPRRWRSFAASTSAFSSSRSRATTTSMGSLCTGSSHQHSSISDQAPADRRRGRGGRKPWHTCISNMKYPSDIHVYLQTLYGYIGRFMLLGCNKEKNHNGGRTLICEAES